MPTRDNYSWVFSNLISLKLLTCNCCNAPSKGTNISFWQLSLLLHANAAEYHYSVDWSVTHLRDVYPAGIPTWTCDIYSLHGYDTKYYYQVVWSDAKNENSKVSQFSGANRNLWQLLLTCRSYETVLSSLLKCDKTILGQYAVVPT